MTLQALSAPRFVRKTQLGPNEYRKNFFQIDREVMAAVTSPEADQVTPLMSKIYLRMVSAPEKFWEREGVLRIEAELEDEKVMKAWSVLCGLLGVASATASKALAWMHEQGIIGYFSGKNGVGMRVFLNRAISSIGVRKDHTGQKNLPVSLASRCGTRASPNEPAFNDSFAVLEGLDKDINPHAPKSGADAQQAFATAPARGVGSMTSASLTFSANHTALAVPVEQIVERLRKELEPCVQIAATRAATQAASREHAQTREWLDKHGIPKATRVAQKEAYEVLRRHGMIGKNVAQARPAIERAAIDHRDANGFASPPPARPLTPAEIADLAATCVALYEAQGKTVEETLRGANAEAGGWVLAEDIARVCEAARNMLVAHDTGVEAAAVSTPPGGPAIAATAQARGCR